MTITHEALNLTVQAPMPSPETPTMDPYPPQKNIGRLPAPPLETWRSVQTYSFADLPIPSITSYDIWWSKHVRLGNGRYATYWNAFFYSQTFLFSAKCDAEVERAYNQMEKFKDQNVSRHQLTMQRVPLKKLRNKANIYKRSFFTMVARYSMRLSACFDSVFENLLSHKDISNPNSRDVMNI